jgi:putative transposase
VQRSWLAAPQASPTSPLRLASSGAYFVTVCSRERACIFARVLDDRVDLSPIGGIVEESWFAIPRHHRGVQLDAFVVMPNHVHGIVALHRAGQVRPLPLPAIVGAFKGRASRIAGRRLWQRGYYERVIRGEEELGALREYIEQNPLRWALDRENPNHL